MSIVCKFIIYNLFAKKRLTFFSNLFQFRIIQLIAFSFFTNNHKFLILVIVLCLKLGIYHHQTLHPLLHSLLEQDWLLNPLLKLFWALYGMGLHPAHFD